MSVEQIQYIPHILQRTFSLFWPKFWLSLATLPLIMFDPSHKEAYLALLLLIIIDFCSGVLVAKKIGQPISSAKIFRSALKVVVYFGMVGATHLTEVSTGGEFLETDAIVIGFLAVTELISILENAGRAGYAIPQKLLNTLHEYAQKQQPKKKIKK